MSSERYSPEAGFLLYLKTGSLHPVVASHMDRRGTWSRHADQQLIAESLPHNRLENLLSELLKLRNTLIHHVHNCVERRGEKSRLAPLPEILTNRQTCQYCPQSRNCALYER